MLDLIKNGKGELLKFFFFNSEKEYYFREIAKKLSKEPSYYQRYLDEFVNEGILQDERKGNMRFFRLNKDYYLFTELKSIISKSFGIEHELKNLLDKFDNLDCAFLFGSIAKKEENSNSDVDLMLVGEIDQDVLIDGITKVEKEIGREINYHIFSRPEIMEKIKQKESFFINIFSSPVIPLRGNLYEFFEAVK